MTRQPVFKLEVTPQEDDDFRLNAQWQQDGIQLHVDVTLNQVRDFFTQRRQGPKQCRTHDKTSNRALMALPVDAKR